MSIPIGDNDFLHELELNVRAELTRAETGQPYEEAAGVPIDEWLSDPADDQRYEIDLRSLLDAVEALEDGSGPAPGRDLGGPYPGMAPAGRGQHRPAWTPRPCVPGRNLDGSRSPWSSASNPPRRAPG